MWFAMHLLSEIIENCFLPSFVHFLTLSTRSRMYKIAWNQLTALRGLFCQLYCSQIYYSKEKKANMHCNFLPSLASLFFFFCFEYTVARLGVYVFKVVVDNCFSIHHRVQPVPIIINLPRDMVCFRSEHQTPCRRSPKPDPCPHKCALVSVFRPHI